MTTHDCPICDEPAPTGEDNPWRPFCSERCKLIDLGRWLGGDYAIPGRPVPREPEHTER